VVDEEEAIGPDAELAVAESAHKQWLVEGKRVNAAVDENKIISRP
jgi:hypothetical protein